MNDIKEVKSYLISKSIDLNKKIRDWEDLCKKIGVDPQGDRAYTAITAYRDAINEVLREIKSQVSPPTSSLE